MKRYLAVKINGEVFIMNDTDELGGLIDCDVPHETLGEVCDSQEFGDNCNTDCPLFCSGTCRSILMRDKDGQLWHVITQGIVNSMDDDTYWAYRNLKK